MYLRIFISINKQLMLLKPIALSKYIVLYKVENLTRSKNMFFQTIFFKQCTYIVTIHKFIISFRDFGKFTLTFSMLVRLYGNQSKK